MKNSPAVDQMYNDMIKEKGALWLYRSVLKVLPRLIPTVVSMWFKTRDRKKRLPFFDYPQLLAQPLLKIRQDFDLLPLI